ncbi:hypothetical protein [Salinibacterium sp. TMP30]|uniref:hypothetical protein n=1 Tax=Salinibacterium sp. TMP30 TaxID=3138237 RepID=UPI003139E2DA
MVPYALPLLAATDAAELARGTIVAVVALIVLVLLLGAGAFVVLFRRGGDRGRRGATSQASLDSQAAALLVSLDDRVRDAHNEVGFAVAQFGAASARDFDSALTDAKLQLTEAFRLGQQRDTAASDAEQLRRRNSRQMIAICEKALANLDRFDAAFAERRRTEVDAAQTVRALREQLCALRDRLLHSQQECADAAHRFGEVVLAPAARYVTHGEAFLDRAEQELDVASPEISSTGVNAVADRLHAAATELHRADQQLAASERALAELADAELAVGRMRDTSAGDLREARLALERAPDPDTGAAIVAAIAAVEKALTETAVDPGATIDPFTQLIALGDAGADLDAALATARNQQQRFEHARAAYRGTLIAARSQISAVRELIGRGGASASARTRLAEAERQLMIAEAETDPVEALDAIRRSVTHARDADALARY